MLCGGAYSASRVAATGDGILNLEVEALPADLGYSSACYNPQKVSG